MLSTKTISVASILAFAASVTAHGYVSGVSIDGIYYPGYEPEYIYLSTQPTVIGWSIPEDLNRSYIAPDKYNHPNIICHLDATNGQTSAPIKAGESINMQWTIWPDSHHGPVLTYMANCNGDCTTVNKTTLEWFKIDELGLLNDTILPGIWATDTLIANNMSWTSTIPSDLASGNYVIRHEIIALHTGDVFNGAQNYPFCLNVQVSGTGIATPSGVLGTALYSETDAGIWINIYDPQSTYEIPGPTLYSNAVTASQTAAPSATAVGTGVSYTTTSASVASPIANSTATASSSSSTGSDNATSSATTVNSAMLSSSMAIAFAATLAASFLM